jgi:hypothetical protein
VKTEIIKINVPSDMIEQHLLNVVNGHPNAHTLVHSIIGVGKISGKLGHMFMGSLGVLPTQQYGIGEEVICTSNVYDYHGIVGEADRPQCREVGNCRVIEFRPYNDEQYVVEYTHVDKHGNTDRQTTTATANQISALPLQPPTEIYGVL